VNTPIHQNNRIDVVKCVSSLFLIVAGIFLNFIFLTLPTYCEWPQDRPTNNIKYLHIRSKCMFQIPT
jgi:hypothetical protein